MQMPTSSTVWWAPVCRSPLRRDGQLQAAVAGQQVEHVVKEADPGVALALAEAVQGELDLDVGLGGLAVDLGGRLIATHCRECGPPSTRRARSKPSARASGAAARASADAPSPIRTSLMRRRKCWGESAEANRAAPLVGSTWLEPAM